MPPAKTAVKTPTKTTKAPAVKAVATKASDPAKKTTATKAPAMKAVATKALAPAKTPTKTSVKTTAAKKASSKASAADLARRTIEKKTGQKAVSACFSTYPHVPSGSFAINDLIGGSLAMDGKSPICPGYPRKRLTEMYGPESSGKTTIALHAIAEAQKAGGLAMFLDFEHALDHSYAKRLGVSFDTGKLLLYAPDTFEEGIQIMNIGLQAGVDIIVVDSVPSMVPKEEMEAKLDKESRYGALARALGKNLPKLVSWLNNDKYLVRNPEGAAVIFLNQERANIGGGPKASKVKTTGGFAMKFYTSLRIQVNGIFKESVKRKNKFTRKEVTVPYGTVTQIKIAKNKIDAKQGQTHTIFIRYGIGIDDTYSLIEAACNHGVIQKGGGGYLTFGSTTIQGREKFRSLLLQNPKMFEEIRKVLISVVRAEAEDLEPEEDLTEAEVMERSFDEAFEDEAPLIREVEHEEGDVELGESDNDHPELGEDPDGEG